MLVTGVFSNYCELLWATRIERTQTNRAPRVSYRATTRCSAAAMNATTNATGVPGGGGDGGLVDELASVLAPLTPLGGDVLAAAGVLARVLLACLGWTDAASERLELASPVDALARIRIAVECRRGLQHDTKHDGDPADGDVVDSIHHLPHGLAKLRLGRQAKAEFLRAAKHY